MSAWRRLVALLSTQEDGLSLALVRILVGASVALHVANQWSTGAAALVWVDASFGGVREIRSPLGGGMGPDELRVWMGATIAAGALLAGGVGTRLAAVLTWLGYRVLADLNGHAGGSYDELLKNILFLLVLADTGARLSVDALVRPARRVSAWPRWLLVFQLVVMYTSTALQKVSDHWVPWGSHDALWYVLQQPTWQRWPMAWVAPAMPILSFATVTVWIFEIGAPVLILAFWYRLTRDRPGRLRAAFNRWDVRAWFLAYGFVMHLGIEATMEVGAFFPATMACYLACFSPDEWARALAPILGGRPDSGATRTPRA